MLDLPGKQLRILDMLIAWETVICEMYRDFQELAADDAIDWMRYASEEKEHIQALEQIRDFVRGGALLRHVGGYQAPTIEAEIANVKETVARARRQRAPSTHELAKLALSLEVRSIDSDFFATVNCDSAPITALAERMRTACKAHIERLRKDMRSLAPTLQIDATALQAQLREMDDIDEEIVIEPPRN